MLSSWVFISLITLLFTLSVGVPVNDGEDVGKVVQKGGTMIVTGQTNYPFLVDITIKTIHAMKTSVRHCTGTIIRNNVVLTAAHCLRGLMNPTIIVHAGIVDIEFEFKKGQKLLVKDYLIHKEFQNQCPVGKNQCCYLANDIALMWLYKEFNFAPNIKPATLNWNEEKPAGKNGWIVGWGDDNDYKRFSMLQKGLVEVMSHTECTKFNPYLYIPATLLCVKAMKGKKTSIADGDSGGPLVINGVVYGICSQTFYSASCRRKTIEAYTDVSKYTTWIRRNLKLGPPKQRTTN